MSKKGKKGKAPSSTSLSDAEQKALHKMLVC